MRVTSSSDFTKHRVFFCRWYMKIFLFDLISEKKILLCELMYSRNSVEAYQESKVTAEKPRVSKALSKSSIAIWFCL